MYNGVKSDREPVNVGIWDYYSQVNNTIEINHAEFWWLDIEGSDDSCEWKFIVYHNGIEIGSKVEDCQTDGSTLSPVNYSIELSLDVLEGDHIQIEVIY